MGVGPDTDASIFAHQSNKSVKPYRSILGSFVENGKSIDNTRHLAGENYL